ncbi:MAG: aminoacyl-tRNA hydrolase, partial [Chloroflexia bacterium]
MPLFRRPPVAEYLLVGLGNPGEAYVRTRHNVGFRCLSVLAARHRLSFRQKHGQARLAIGEIAGRRVVLARPYTYMNRSGTAVADLLKWLQLPLERLLVIHDDLDLPLGTIRLRPRGSAGGHRGMRSIIEALGTESFPRLRVGIGRPANPAQDPIDYVLSPFTAEEEPVLAGVLERAADAV